MAPPRPHDPERAAWHRGGSAAYAIYRAEIEKSRPGFWHAPDQPGRARPAYERNAPDLRFAFDRTDPDFEAQFADLGRSEAERREDGGRGSRMIEEDAPAPALKPQERRDVDRAAFAERWRREAADAARSQISERATSIEAPAQEERQHEPRMTR